MAEIDVQPESQMHFLTAPALETVFALGALAKPDRRPFVAAWAAEVEAQLTASEREHLQTLRGLPEHFVIGDLAFTHRCFQDVNLLAAYVREKADWVNFLLYGFFKPEQIAAWQAAPDGASRLRQEHPWLWGGDEAVLDLILHRGDDLREAVATLLPRVWELGVAPMLPRLEPLWAKTIAQAREEAEGKDPKSFAFGVYGKAFARRYGPDHVFPQYLFAPTYFFSPMKVAFFEPDLALVTLDCRLGPWAMQTARNRVAEGLRAVAEENRLEILRLLTMDKGFGGWVAGRLKLNPATVTHHMNLLRKSGLLKEDEGPPGAAKYYRTDREAVRRLIQLLEDYLDGNLEPDWEGESKP
ncbi:MAG TPA: helix-turn-helix transcriptional regulator [Symbiobacteriaceae bacterium]|nr:helix-turn-helix transcriptional regulator [Symbiobacteriaceae bacterium]